MRSAGHVLQTASPVARDGDTQVPVSPVRGDPAPRGALYEAALQQVWLVDVLDGVARLGEGHGDGTDANGPAVELVDDETEVIPVGPVEPKVVDALHVEGGVGSLLVDLALANNLSIVAHPFQKPVHDARRPAAAAGELARATFGDGDFQYPRAADHDLLQILGPIIFEPLGDAEPVEQGLGKQALPGSRADQREAR